MYPRSLHTKWVSAELCASFPQGDRVWRVGQVPPSPPAQMVLPSPMGWGRGLGGWKGPSRTLHAGEGGRESR